MQLIASFYTQAKANKLRRHLEKNGIAVYVEYEGARGSGIKYSVFSALDHQHQDALLLMSDPDHVVVHKIDVSEYQAYTEGADGKEMALELMMKGICVFILLVISLVGLIIFFSKAN